MSDQQLAELYERLVAGKAPGARVDQAFKRGWNAGLDYAIRQMRIVCGEEVPAETE